MTEIGRKQNGRFGGTKSEKQSFVACSLMNWRAMGDAESRSWAFPKNDHL
jgi:hypothetical protein